MQSVKNINELGTFLRRVGNAAKSSLLLDYDGTLAPFCTDRSRAYPYPGVISVLENIARSGKTKVVVVSGRPIAQLQVLLAPMNDLEMWGSHGLEHQSSEQGYRHTPIIESVASVLQAAVDWAAIHNMASRIEVKPGGVALHWRGLSQTDAVAVEAAVKEGWRPLGEELDLKLLEFEMGLELRIAHPDKGDAVRAVLESVDPRMPLAFLGDDRTDEDAFRALKGHGLTVLVKADYRETAADAWIRPPQELLDFLDQWLLEISE